MKTVLDYPDIDALSVVELPDRNVICDCGCPLIEVNILSGDTFVIGSYDTFNTAVNVCGNQIGGTPVIFDDNGNIISFDNTSGLDSIAARQDSCVECASTQGYAFMSWLGRSLVLLA